MCVYIHIYIYVCIYVYIYIYIGTRNRAPDITNTIINNEFYNLKKTQHYIQQYITNTYKKKTHRKHEHPLENAADRFIGNYNGVGFKGNPL